MKVFQIRQDDRFAWYETDQEQMEQMVNVCGWQGRVLELAKEAIPAQTGMIGISVVELSNVINNLESGCDPKEAAKELRLYGERAWTGAMPAADYLPPLPTPAATEQKMYLDPVLWFTEDQMQGRYKQGRSVGLQEAYLAVRSVLYARESLGLHEQASGAQDCLAAIRALKKTGAA